MPSYNRARRFGGGGGGINLAALFGALGGGEVTAEGANEGEFGPEDERIINFKPSRPVLNVLSGGQGSQLANQANLEQYLNAQEYQRKLSAAKEASKLQVSAAKELDDHEIGNLPRRLAIGNISNRQRLQDASDISLMERAHSMFVDRYGKTPEEAGPEWEEYLASTRLGDLFKQQTEEQTTESQRKTAINKYGQQLDASVFPYELQSKTNTARAGIPKSLEEEYRASESMKLAPFDVGLKRKQLEGAIEDESTNRLLDQATRANVFYGGQGGGVFNRLTGKNRQFGGGVTGLEPYLNEDTKAPSVSPYGKEGGVYDPFFDEWRYPKQQQQQQLDTGTSPISPRGQSPSNAFSPLPVTGLGGSPAKDEALRIAVQNLINSKGVQGNVGIPSRLDTLSTQELRDLYDKLSK